MKIEAKWVHAGVGLPPMWRDSGGLVWTTSEYELAIWAGKEVDLGDPQTAFGLALILDKWERAGNSIWPYRQGMSKLHKWVDRITMWSESNGKSHPSCLYDMAHRLEEIGMDHHIRRRLGWDVELGTLARFESHPTELILGTEPGEWVFKYAAAKTFSDLPGVSTAHEALKVIAEAIT